MTVMMMMMMMMMIVIMMLLSAAAADDDDNNDDVSRDFANHYDSSEIFSLCELYCLYFQILLAAALYF